ncbi:MAG TPA: hypothetical protein PKD90_18150, partial [Phnomibacter sp.]|nr:hypothetical protein [Phnomibacter sp.]
PPASLVQPAVSKYSLEAPPEATAAKPAFINLLQHIEQARQAIFVASAHPDESLLPEPRFNDTRPIAWEIKDKPLPAENQAIDNQDEPAEPVFAGLEATQSAAANRALTKQLSAIASVKWSDVLEQVEVAVVHNATKASSLPPLKGWVMAADSIKVLPLKELLASLTKLNAKKLTVWETQRLATQPAPVAGTQHHKGLQTQLELREQKIAEANARYQQALANKAAEQMQAAERYLHRQQMVMQRQMEELQQKYLAKALAYEKLSQQQTSNLSYSYNLPDYDEEAMQQRASLYSRAAQAPVARVAVQRSRQAAVPPLKEQTQEPTGWIGADVDDKAIEQAIAATAGTIVVRIADAATEAISKARLELDLHNLARQIQNLAIQMELNANKLSMPAPDSNLQLPPATATPPLTTPAKRRIVHL